MIPFSPLDGGIGLFMVALAVSVLTSSQPATSLAAFLPWPAIMGVYYLPQMNWLNRKQVQRVLPWLWGFFIVTSVAGLVLHQDTRLAGITDSPNTLAVLLAMTTPATASRFARKQSLMMMIAGAFLVVLTKSRSGIIGYFLAVAVFYGLQRVLRAKHLLAGAVAVAAFLPVLRPDTLDLLTDGKANRSQFWGVAVDMWRTSPWVGTGLSTYGRFYQAQFSGFTFDSAHNWFLQMLAETGLAGAGGLVLIALSGLVFVYRKRNLFARKPFAIGLLAGLCAFLWHCQWDTPGPVVLAVASGFAGLLVGDLSHIDQRRA